MTMIQEDGDGAENGKCLGTQTADGALPRVWWYGYLWLEYRDKIRIMCLE